MAMRKETIKRQFAEAAQPLLQPGEEVRAGAFGVTGPSPWLIGLIGVLGMFLAGMRYGYLFVTDRRIIFMKASFWSQRPAELGWVDPRASVQITDVNASGRVWCHFGYVRPEGKRLRLNFARIWRDEFDGVLSELGAASPSPEAGG